MITSIGRYKNIISIAAFSIIYLYTLDNYWKPIWDSAIYISLGKSIAAGSGYYYMGLPHAKYPFIFPLMLSPIIALFNLNFLLMRFLIIVLTISSIYLSYTLFKKFADERMAFFIMLLTGFSSTLLHVSTWILSEIPYMLFSLYTLYFMAKYSEEKNYFTRTGILSSTFLLTAIFTRMMGITLFIAFLCHFLFNKDIKNNIKKAVLVGLIASIPLCFWFYRSHLINKNIPFQPEYRGVLSYEKEFFLKVPDDIHSESISFKDLTQKIKSNLRMYSQNISNIMVKKVPFEKSRLFITLLSLYGLCWCFVKRRTVIEYYLSFYLIACVIWWFNQHPQRFLAPVIPFLFYYFLIGIKRSIELFQKMIVKVVTKRVETVKGIILGLLVLSLILANFSFNPRVLKRERRKQFHPPTLVSEFFSAIKWINEHTSQDSAIMSSRAPWLIMFTDRITLTWPLFESLPNVITSILQNRVDYIVVSNIHQETYRLLHSFVEKHPKQFTQVFLNNKTSIYKIKRENFPSLVREMDKTFSVGK